MSDDDHRNTLIVLINDRTKIAISTLQGDGDIQLAKRAVNWLGGISATPIKKESKNLLKELNLLKEELVMEKPDGSRTIEWMQTNRAVFGNSEQYIECTYKMKNPKLAGKVKVFVAKSCGPPPETFNTAGYQQNGADLHFGYIYQDEEKDVKAIFFVIHSPVWEPFQKRFRTNSMLSLLDDSVKYAAEKVGGKVGTVVGGAIGTLIPIPVVGTAIGAAVGYFAAEATVAIVDGLSGDYLRYIG